MSITFSTIRRMSTVVGTNDATGITNDVSMTSSNLAHTLSMACQDDTSKFQDSLSLSNSLQTVKRHRFHKHSNNEEKREENKNPFSKKSITDLLTTSLRTNCDKPLENIVETISIALADIFNESYGSPDKPPREGTDGSKVGIDIKEMKNLVYKCTNLSFNPHTCTWTGVVCYNCQIEMKHPSSDDKMQKVHMPYNGSFMFHATVQTVQVSSNEVDRGDQFMSCDSIVEDEQWISPSSKMLHEGKNHLCIDIEAALSGTDDDDIRSQYDRNTLKVMSQTITHIGYDVSRALYWLDLPEFPEGCKDIKFRTVYQLNKKIKSGAFATVCLATRRATSEKVAVKCVQRKNLPPSDDVAIHSEVGIVGSLRHQYICPIIDFFMEDECYFIVMDLMEGGDVFDRVGELEYYDESIARDLCHKMLTAIAFCHDQNVAHCDLKPKNLLLKKKGDDSSVMLADFGFATSVFAPKSLTKQCGTPYFVAPEILLREPYDQQADMWSVGVIIFSLLSGQLPFTGKRHLDLFKSIIAGDFTFNEEWEEISDDAKDLISKLLVTDPDKRYTAKDALASKWIRANTQLLKSHSLMSASSRLKTFNARLKLKSTILVIQTLVRWRRITGHSLEARRN